MESESETFLTNRGYAILKENNTKCITYLKKLLTVKPKANPSMGLAGNEFPVYLESSSKLYIPKAFGLGMFGLPKYDKLHKGHDAPRLIFNGTLRQEQEAPVAAFLESAADPLRRGGIISLACAAGKTVIALYISTQLKKKTLVLCHKEFLMNQWKERINQFVPNAKVGLIKGKDIIVDDCDIVIGSVQSIAMKDYDSAIFKQFGFVVSDECHHLSAEVFSKVLPKVTAAVMLGLSATLNRKDGLRKVFEWHLGKPVFQTQKRADTELIVEVLRVPAPSSRTPDYGEELLMWNGKRNISGMINLICSYKPRNKLILDRLASIEKDRRTLILSDRRGHLKYLEEQIIKLNIGSVGYYVGGMKEKDLKESESKDIILGTYSMASEGMDIPCLNTLILASPISSIEQSIGRVQRQKAQERKYTPLVIDVCDNYSLFANQARKRIDFYKKNGYTVIDASMAVEEADIEEGTYDFIADDD
jgi:superfamily II DNA or RNA helicase